jgi:hypothetical protein
MDDKHPHDPLDEDTYEADPYKRYGIDRSKLPADKELHHQFLLFAQYHDNIPIWQAVSGLYSQLDYRGEDRRVRVRQIVNLAKWLIRQELLIHDQDPNKAERTVYWDPLREVCERLQLSHSKLSAFCKELTGLSISQTVDAIRPNG